MTGLLNARVAFGKTPWSQSTILNVDILVVSVCLVTCITLLYLYGSKRETSDHKRSSKLKYNIIIIIIHITIFQEGSKIRAHRVEKFESPCQTFT